MTNVFFTTYLAYSTCQFFLKYIGLKLGGHYSDTEIKKFLETLEEETKKAEKTKKTMRMEKLVDKMYKSKKKNKKNSYYFDVNPFLKNITRVDLTAVPGIDTNIAMKIIAEIGSDMTPWKTSKQFSIMTP